MHKESSQSSNTIRERVKAHLNLRTVLILLALVLPVLIVVVLFAVYGSNVPFWDEWDFLTRYKTLQENGLSLQYIWDLFRSQHNEHRIFTAYVAHMLIWQITNCNDYFTAWALYGCLIGVTFIVFLYCRHKHYPLIYLLPIPVLAFSLRQGFMLFLPVNLMTPMLIICVTASFYLYFKYEGSHSKYLYLSVMLALLATYCRAEGLLIWLAYAVFFLAQSLFEKKKLFRKDSVCFFAVGITTYILYLYDWQWSSPEYASKNIWKVLKAFITSLGSPFVLSGTDAWIAYIFGAMILGTFVVLIYCVCKEKVVTEMRFSFLMIVFYFGGALLTVLGRSELPILISQYAPMPFWLIISLYLELVELFRRKKVDFTKVSIILFSFFFALSIGSFENESKDKLDILQAAAYCVQNWDEAPDEMKRTYVYPATDEIEERLEWIRENHYFLFNSGKKYQYPFEDYFIAERLDKFVMPSEEGPVGDFYVDFINNNAIPPDGIITVTSDEGLNFIMWALDNVHDSVPTRVIVEIADNHYELKRYAREDVASVYSNQEYTNSGFRGYVATRKLQSGEYPVKLIVLCDGGNSYYSTVVATVKVTD